MPLAVVLSRWTCRLNSSMVEARKRHVVERTYDELYQVFLK